MKGCHKVTQFLALFLIINLLRMQNKQLKIVDVPIGELKPSEYNPRTWDKEAIRNMTESIKRFGMVDPVICNCAPGRENIVIGGHFRLHVAKLLSFTTVPVIYLNIRNLDMEKELNLRLNRNTGTWDLELLKNFDLNMLLDVGFNDNDLSEIWDKMLETEDDSFNQEERIKEIKTTDIKTGNLFQLGCHFLICGDSHDESTLNSLMKDQKVDMVYNDPIYNIGIDYDKGVGGKANYGGNINDNKSDAEYREFLTLGLKNSLVHAKKDCHIFTWNDQKHIWLVQSIYNELKIKNERACFWFKGSFNPTPNVAFNKAVEFCIYGTTGKPYLSKLSTKTCEVLNKEINTGNRSIDDILDILEIWIAKRDAGNELGHSTQKPITVHEKPLLRCTKPGDIILDIYGGSGSTLLACEQLKRVCYTAEINPIFCQLIINRFEEYANIKAKKIN